MYKELDQRFMNVRVWVTNFDLHLYIDHYQLKKIWKLSEFTFSFDKNFNKLFSSCKLGSINESFLSKIHYLNFQSIFKSIRKLIYADFI